MRQSLIFFFSLHEREIKLKFPNRRWNELKYKFPVKIVVNDNFLVVRSGIETAWEEAIPREKFIPCTFHFSCSWLPSLEKIDLSRASLLRIPSPRLPQFRASDIRGSNRKFLFQDCGRVQNVRDFDPKWILHGSIRDRFKYALSTFHFSLTSLDFFHDFFLPRFHPLKHESTRSSTRSD